MTVQTILILSIIVLLPFIVRATPGDACDTVENVCPFGEACEQGICLSALGNACSGDLDCLSTTCIDERCVASISLGEECNYLENRICFGEHVSCIEERCVCEEGYRTKTEGLCEVDPNFPFSCAVEGSPCGSSGECEVSEDGGLKCINKCFGSCSGGRCDVSNSKYEETTKRWECSSDSPLKTTSGYRCSDLYEKDSNKKNVKVHKEFVEEFKGFKLTGVRCDCPLEAPYFVGNTCREEEEKDAIVTLLSSGSNYGVINRLSNGKYASKIPVSVPFGTDPAVVAESVCEDLECPEESCNGIEEVYNLLFNVTDTCEENDLLIELFPLNEKRRLSLKRGAVEGGIDYDVEVSSSNTIMVDKFVENSDQIVSTLATLVEPIEDSTPVSPNTNQADSLEQDTPSPTISSSTTPVPSFPSYSRTSSRSIKNTLLLLLSVPFILLG